MCSLPKLTPKSLTKAAFDPMGFVTKDPDPLEVFGPKATGDAPAIVQDTPLADQAKVDADAAAAGIKSRTALRRRRRRSSLLETGGAGDDSAFMTSMPTAVPGKASLGG